MSHVATALLGPQPVMDLRPGIALCIIDTVMSYSVPDAPNETERVSTVLVSASLDEEARVSVRNMALGYVAARCRLVTVDKASGWPTIAATEVAASLPGSEVRLLIDSEDLAVEEVSQLCSTLAHRLTLTVIMNPVDQQRRSAKFRASYVTLPSGPKAVSMVAIAQAIAALTAPVCHGAIDLAELESCFGSAAVPASLLLLPDAEGVETLDAVPEFSAAAIIGQDASLAEMGYISSTLSNGPAAAADIHFMGASQQLEARSVGAKYVLIYRAVRSACLGPASPPAD